MGQGLMDYKQCPVDGCWHIKRGLRFAMCYSQTSGGKDVQLGPVLLGSFTRGDG